MDKNYKLVYLCGTPNEKFNSVMENLGKHGKAIKSYWSGDFYVTEYEMFGHKYIYSEDMDLGIPYSIERRD